MSAVQEKIDAIRANLTDIEVEFTAVYPDKPDYENCLNKITDCSFLVYDVSREILKDRTGK